MCIPVTPGIPTGARAMHEPCSHCVMVTWALSLAPSCSPPSLLLFLQYHIQRLTFSARKAWPPSKHQHRVQLVPKCNQCVSSNTRKHMKGRTSSSSSTNSIPMSQVITAITDSTGSSHFLARFPMHSLSPPKARCSSLPIALPCTGTVIPYDH